jgi:peptidyl-prolyl cis-trans isomerase A (cyclophilin A)
MKSIIPFLIAAFAWAHLAVAQQPTKTTSTTKKSTAATTHKSATTSKNQPSLLDPSSLKEPAPAYYRAKFRTTKGDFVIEVWHSWSPQGADRFYNLVKYHFYDGAAFFRVLPGFVVQFGISPKPEVSRVWESATIPDDPVTQANIRGMVTFATAGANTRTTQVFINLGDNATLNNMGFAPIGKVQSGMDVVDKFYGGYGEGAPDGNGPNQDRMQKEGKTYIEKFFPLLDTIKSAEILP